VHTKFDIYVFICTNLESDTLDDGTDKLALTYSDSSTWVALNRESGWHSMLYSSADIWGSYKTYNIAYFNLKK
jgi:hypothetical protein